MANLNALLVIAILALFAGGTIGSVANSTTGQVQAPHSISLYNTCQAESHVGVSSLSCTLTSLAGNWIVATGSAAGTNTLCAGDPILGINTFSFDAGALYTSWHGPNKLSVETYDSGQLTTSGALLVTLNGQCQMSFATLTVYQLKGVTKASQPASVNTCSAQLTGVTTLSCILTALPGNGWIVGHAGADCAACSYTNQINTITQASGINFTDYAGTITTVTPNVANSFAVTNGTFNGGVSAIEVTGPIIGNSNVTSSPGIPATVPILALFFVGSAIGLMLDTAKKSGITLAWTKFSQNISI